MEKLYNMTINPNHAYNIADNENMLSLYVDILSFVFGLHSYIQACVDEQRKKS